MKNLTRTQLRNLFKEYDVTVKTRKISFSDLARGEAIRLDVYKNDYLIIGNGKNIFVKEDFEKYGDIIKFTNEVRERYKVDGMTII